MLNEPVHEYPVNGPREGVSYSNGPPGRQELGEEERSQPGRIEFVPGVDLVNHPPHYTKGKIEVIDFIEDQQLGFHEAQVIKYVARAKHKGNEMQDLMKARWYLDRLIKNKSNSGAS